MSEWWSYRLGDFLLFAPRTYYRLIEAINRDLWPWQVVAILAGLAVLLLTAGYGPRWRGRVVAAFLAVAWLWVAWAFHLRRYATINWAARWFAVGFAVEALLLLWAGGVRGRLLLGAPHRTIQRLALVLLALALAAVPLAERLLGRPWARIELFGLFPDATALATLGVLLASRRSHGLLVVVPLLWCAIGGATLAAMANPEAVLPWAGALLALGLTVWKTLAPGKPEVAG
jgi:hypothetical protein